MKDDFKEQNAASKIAPKTALRQEVLETAIKYTMGDRTETYGPPGLNMACFAAFLDIYLHYSKLAGKEPLGNMHDAAIVNVLSKLSRIAIAPKPHKDNYIDGAAYFAMAFEVSQ
jgi:hypothetical protein